MYLPTCSYSLFCNTFIHTVLCNVSSFIRWIPYNKKIASPIHPKLIGYTVHFNRHMGSGWSVSFMFLLTWSVLLFTSSHMYEIGDHKLISIQFVKKKWFSSKHFDIAGVVAELCVVTNVERGTTSNLPQREKHIWRNRNRRKNVMDEDVFLHPWIMNPLTFVF